MVFVKISGLRNSFQLDKVEIISEMKWTINPDNNLYDFFRKLNVNQLS